MQSSNSLFFSVIGSNITIFLNDRESASGYLISIVGKSFASDFQRQQQKLAL